MTRAAGLLGVPQSTLSRGIARLEADLGAALFVRAGRTIRLTRAGQSLLTAAERALAELDTGVREVAGEVDPVRGRVALAFLHTLGAEAVPMILKGFRAEHPGIRVELVQDRHDAVLAKLRAAEVDLCLTSPLPEEAGIATRALQEQRLSLAVPAGHRFATRRDIRLAEAAQEQFVGFAPAYGMRRISDEWCRQAGFSPVLAFEGQDVETLRGLVTAGLGVALLPTDTGRGALGVVDVRVTEPRTTRTVGVAWMSERPAPAPVQALRDFVLRTGRL